MTGDQRFHQHSCSRRHRRSRSRSDGCSKCVGVASEDDWSDIDDETKVVLADENEVYRVRCVSCGREIEFGWKGEPEDNGSLFGSARAESATIWPCEAVDFNPGTCEPDEKYREAWELRGWLPATTAARKSTSAE